MKEKVQLVKNYEKKLLEILEKNHSFLIYSVVNKILSKCIIKDFSTKKIFINFKGQMALQINFS